jgi:type IV pilus assembly protein PilA
MKTMKNIQKGFTLIELMIVIAILGILMAIAIPAYSDYTSRARASEALLAGAPIKQAVSEYYATNGVYPPTSADVGADPDATTYFASWAYTDGAGTFDLTAQATDCPGGEPVFTFTPTATANRSVQWVCTSSNARCAPASCR